MTIDLAPPAGGQDTAERRREERRRRERRWQELTRLQADVARLLVERMCHGIVERDAVDDFLDTVEELLAVEYPRRWKRMEPARAAASAGWWHDGADIDRDGLPAVLACEQCRRLAGGLSHWLQMPV